VMLLQIQPGSSQRAFATHPVSRSPAPRSTEPGTYRRQRLHRMSCAECLGYL
jgi:hypothetical protein